MRLKIKKLNEKRRRCRSRRAVPYERGDARRRANPVGPRGVSQRVHEVRLRESQKRTLFPRDNAGGSGRFASVTDVKVLADCAYPMSLRTNLVRDGTQERTVEQNSRKRKSRSRRRRNRRWRWRRNRERPFLEPPTKNKIFFPTRIFSTSLSVSSSLAFPFSLFLSLSLVSPLATRPSSSISTHKNATTVTPQPRTRSWTGPESLRIAQDR